MSKKELRLTVKQRKFIKYYLETGNASQSALRAGYSNRHSAYETLTNPHIQAIFQEFLDTKGLSDETLANKHIKLLNAQKVQACDVFIRDDNGKLTVNKNSNDFIEVDDNSTQLGALKLAYELKERTRRKSDQNGEGKGATRIIIIRSNGEVKANERIEGATQTVSR